MVKPATLLNTAVKYPAVFPVTVALEREIYKALEEPSEVINGYLLVAFVGSVPAVIAVPVAAVVHHLENDPLINPVPTGAVNVPPAALFPK